ncbi:MAG: ABC transporter permease [Vicinamibacterales bacterium]|nr:ABC transporter permease [Vicinamibacterales bacterium]
MSALLQDLRFAARLLLKAPSFTAVALLTLSIGIGASAAIFSIVNTMLLQPLPYPNADRLVMLWQDFRDRGGPRDEWMTPGNYFDWRTRSQSFEDIAVYRGGGASLTGRGEPEQVSGWAVTSGFFGVLGVAPALGRDFTPGDDVPGAEAVVILSHGFWTRRFGADPAIVGQPIALNREPFVVIGVMPEGFRNPFDSPDIWRPVQLNAANPSRGQITLRSFARLKAGTSLAQAQAEMATLGQTLAQEIPDAQQTGILVTPLHERVVGDVRTPLLALLGAVLLVLLIASANIANLLIARSAARAREVAMRKALGASPLRIVRQLLTESLLLGAIGAVGGLLMAGWLLDVLIANAPPGTPDLDRVRIDGTVFAFGAGLAMLTALIFGLAPAVQSATRLMVAVLKESGRGTAGSRRALTLRNLFMVTELALALMLLVGAGLLMRSLVNLQSVDPGLSPDRLLVADVRLPLSGYPEPAARRAFFASLLERLEALPGVEQASFASVVPFTGGDTDTGFRIEGRPEPSSPSEEPVAWVRTVSPGYFRATGMRLEQGRLLEPSDHEEAPRAVVINRALATRYWPDTDPVGTRLRAGPNAVTIVGIVADVRHRELSQPALPQMYLSMAQWPQGAMTAVIKTTGDPAALAPAVRAAVAAIDPSLPVSGIDTLESLMAGTLALPRLLAMLMLTFAGTALLLAAIGIYGLMAYSVSQRTQEFGVRVALGANARDVLGLVLGQAMRLTAAGVLVGAAAAFGVSRLLAALLYDVTPADVPTFAATALALSAVALAAAYLPARRAMRISPVEALRNE